MELLFRVKAHHVLHGNGADCFKQFLVILFIGVRLDNFGFDLNFKVDSHSRVVLLEPDNPLVLFDEVL